MLVALPRTSYCFAGAWPVLPVPVGAVPVAPVPLVLVPGAPLRLIARRWVRPWRRAARRWARAWRRLARRCARVVRRPWRRCVGVCAPGACIPGDGAPGACVPGDCGSGVWASASRLVSRVAGATKANVADSPKSKAFRREIPCELMCPLMSNLQHSCKIPASPSNGEGAMMNSLLPTVKRSVSQ